MKILVCDDDHSIVEAICIYLTNEGYTCLKAYDGQEALEILKKEACHLVLTDIMMPKVDGMALTHRIRETQNIPIIILSAKTEDMDKIMGLNMGADDYLTKPFNPLELIARVKSQLRRYTKLGSMTVTSSNFRSGGLEIDNGTKQVLVDGEEVKVTPLEYNILLFLIRHKGQVFSIDQIYENAWQEPSYQSDNTVAVHIRRIREKIEINPKNPKYLKVVWGIGYKIENYE